MISLILTLASILFFLTSAHQLLYFLIPCILRRHIPPGRAVHPRSAVLICARNEAAVIGPLIASIRRQTAEAEVFVLADNCTDATADAARCAGAVVWERHDTAHVGKGYALSALLSQMEAAGYRFERYFIFDADNLLAPDCLAAMHRVFDAGYPIVTGFRASKNFGDNWISAGYGLFFLRESRFLNGARMLLGTSCAVSGTGFGFTRQILLEQRSCGDFWPFRLLTEDLEFTAHHVLRGCRIGYAPDAVFYDEQPTDFMQSWHQRLRWSKGGLQVAERYGQALLAGARGGSFACWDVFTASYPAAVYNLVCIVCHGILLLDGCFSGDLTPALMSLGRTAGITYLTFFVMGALTMYAERRRIPLSGRKKLLYTLTFPLFMFTYIPISLASFFCKVEWTPIRHKAKGDLCTIS